MGAICRPAQPGSISAWAEEPAGWFDLEEMCGVDLRVGGGTFQRLCLTRSKEGRSPRGRRNLVGRLERHDERGSISAWAEEPWRRMLRQRSRRVDLRVGGGTESPRSDHFSSQGRSPRGRRNPSVLTSGTAFQGSISAWAEEPHDVIASSSVARVDLRVGGGTVMARCNPDAKSGRSPRGRGNQTAARELMACGGAISAGAEEPRGPAAASHGLGVDLRVGGGTLYGSVVVIVSNGRSPRGRRNRSYPAARMHG